MRRLGLLAALTAVLALPATASAQDGEPPCLPSAGGDYQWQAALSPYINTWWNRDGVHNPRGGAMGAAQRALGAQFTGAAMDNHYQGWEVAYAPGPLDATAARAAIRGELAVELTPDAVAFMDSKLRLAPDKYSEAELQAVRDQIGAIAAETGWNLAYGIGCFQTSAWRVQVTRNGVKETPEVVAETEAKFAPFGDKVRLSYSESVPVPGIGTGPAIVPAPAPGPAPTDQAIRVGDYVTRPTTSRCVRRVLTVKAKGGAKVRLSAGKRHASGKRARLALKQRSTRVTVTVTLEDGRTASQTLTFRRC